MGETRTSAEITDHELKKRSIRVDESTNGAITKELDYRTERIQEQRGDEITEADLKSFEKLIVSFHESYAKSGAYG